ncbi:hypothetical protein AIOL_001681 [Candidatus Rhodobacter oscarellae]|uniref:L-ornithine N(alpha)-acyltransferase n=1 Tax=Candidatus Rhodobacter oscarellae TaxID=1675527 RepID=A0A0J9E1F8_9RHOB|nr:GNAT family N-acyltransferase [Candidatus Rhodobacter lobularis]KMW56726.1 hypothetical protein AIOL_001681 [Candidatus Rhodobacter lobularis]
MSETDPQFQLKIAQSAAEREAAQRLRYTIFVEELGGRAPESEQRLRLERDEYDAVSDHLLLMDANRPKGDRVVGTYRLLAQDRLKNGQEFYSAGEFDLDPLRATGLRLLELGRSCVHPAYRGGTAMHELWLGLAAYARAQRTQLMFGVASFHGTDVAALSGPLSYLHHNHLAPADLRVRAKGQARQRMDILAARDLDRRDTVLRVPALIKGYLRLGGVVGDGAWVDHAFNTTDVCMILDVARMPNKAQARYSAAPLEL